MTFINIQKPMVEEILNLMDSKEKINYQTNKTNMKF